MAKFNWWEVLGAGLGTGVGTGVGFLIGGPGGAKVGAGIGYGIGTGISPGGYWNEEKPTTSIKGVDSADLTAAALKEMGAARDIMARQAASDIQALRPRFAGAYQSGARERMEMGVREQYAGRLADALAGISLESQRTVAALQQGDYAMAMQEAQMAWQKQAAEMQGYGAILEAVLSYAIKNPQAQQQTPSLNLGSELGNLGVDEMSLYGWKPRQMNLQDVYNFGGYTLPDGTVVYP